MSVRRCLVGLTFCTCYLASYLTNKYVLSVLKFTYPTLFQGWQTLVGGLLLHVSWKLGWAEINSSSRSDVWTWLPASVLFVGIIYAGSRALSKLAIPVFLTLHNVAEVILCGHQKCFRKEKTSPAKICSALFLLAAAGCLPFNDPQFDPGGYFWAVIHLICVGAYKILQKVQKPSALSDIDQQYLNYMFSVVLLGLASHPTDLFLGNLYTQRGTRTYKPEIKSHILPTEPARPPLLCVQEGGFQGPREQRDPQEPDPEMTLLPGVPIAYVRDKAGDLFSVPDFPFLYFYRFHGSCCASGLLGFFLMLSTMKLKSLMAPGQCAAWIFFAKVLTAGSSVLLFDMILTSATVGCLLLGGLGEALLVFSERKGS
ncbi:transmembrane protein 241 isoform X1 [Mustela nigripes]|uniref:transmembrane protein 241 isoform X1 n=1 Tax=Mustela nigripes TaxID=77151 RepID=UPI002815DF4B|nr:transmembrane protein 241 isoform X1 [Mustela nigripes]